MPALPVSMSLQDCYRHLPSRLWRLAAAAGLLYLALYGSDLAITQDLAAIPPATGLEGQVVAPVPPAWAYVPFDPATAHAGDGAENGPRLDNVVGREQLQRNGLYRRVIEIRRKLGICCDATVKDGAAALSLRTVLDLIGGELAPTSDGVRIINREGQVVLRPGEASASRNFVPTPLPAAPYSAGDDLIVPVRSLCALYEAGFSYDADTGLGEVSYGDKRVRLIASERAFHIEIDRSDRWVRIFYAGELAKHYPACTGEGGNTPVGEFHIQNRCVWPGWRAYWGEYIPGGTSRNPLGARFLGTSARGRATGWTIGIHGTNQPSSIGRRISGGCVRLHNSDIIEVYEVIPIGTRVSIHE